MKIQVLLSEIIKFARGVMYNTVYEAPYFARPQSLYVKNGFYYR